MKVVDAGRKAVPSVLAKGWEPAKPWIAKQLSEASEGEHTMISLLSLFMEAHDEEMNIHRFYAITVGKNLFGLAIHIEYGRKERFRHSRVATKTYLAESLQEAKKKVDKILKKRFSSPRRGGKPGRPPYNIIDASIHTDIPKDFNLSDWIPPQSNSKRTPTPSLFLVCCLVNTWGHAPSVLGFSPILSIISMKDQLLLFL